jgi:hypothetical protein
MNLSPETLSAFIDGELPFDEARRVEAALQDRPDLLAYVEQQHALRMGLIDALAPSMDAPIPDRFLTALAETPVSLRWRISHAFSQAMQPRNLIWSGMPAAAALACGLLIGVAIERGAGADMVAGSQGALIAHGALADALSNKLASEAAPGPSVGVSFRAKDGRYCRTFETTNNAGVACRDTQSWAIAALSAAPAEANGQAAYRPAASAMPDIIRKAVSGMIDGAPFDAAAERNARNNGWVSR